MSPIQMMLDQVLTNRELYSVVDLEFIEPDDVIYIRRKPGHRSVLEFIEPDDVIYIRRKPGHRSVIVDISEDGDPEAVMAHLESVPAFY